MIYRTLRLVIGAFLRVWCRMSVQGLENVPRTGPVILASNHLSFLDSIVIPLAVPRRVRFLAKSDYFTGTGPRGWFTRALFDGMGAVPVPRGSHADAQAALELATGVLQAGDAFGIYPEGTRSRDGRLYRGRTGVAWLALRTGAPIVPVAVLGTERAQPIGSNMPRPHKVTVRFGPAVPVDSVADLRSSGQQRRRLTDRVMDEVAAMTGQPLAGDYNTVQSPVE